jgi:hypothetical protein
MSAPLATSQAMTHAAFFQRMQKFAGMTGTAADIAGTLWEIYKLPVRFLRGGMGVCAAVRRRGAARHLWRRREASVHGVAADCVCHVVCHIAKIFLPKSSLLVTLFKTHGMPVAAAKAFSPCIASCTDSKFWLAGHDHPDKPAVRPGGCT